MAEPLPIAPAGWTATLPAPLALDAPAEIERIAGWLRAQVGDTLRRRGAVVAVSGGIDSAVCAGLAVRALGASRVLGLLLPERESSPESLARGRAVCETLGMDHQVHDISAALEALGAYAARDAAVRQVVPAFGDGWRCRLRIDGGLQRGINVFQLDLASPQGEHSSWRLPHAAYLGIVAATNFKQRVRKVVEYHHADRLNRAVVGTPNRLEHALGFFVRQGDGSADCKPIAHLYKSQVYALGHALGLPEAVLQAAPTTDTYTLGQGQDDFYFAMPLQQVDLAMWAQDRGHDAAAVAGLLGCSAERAQRILADLSAKRRMARTLHAPGLTMASADGAVAAGPGI